MKRILRNLFILLFNLTDRKLAEEKLDKSRELNRAILSSMKDHIAVLDKAGHILSVNSSWFEFARKNDVSSLELVGEGVDYLEVCRRASKDLDETAQQALGGIKAVLDGSQEYFELEYPCHSPSMKRWFLMTVIPFKGEKEGVVIAHKDISLQRKAERQLRKAEINYRTVADFTYDWEYWIDQDDNVNYVSPSSKRITGYRAEEFADRPELLEQIVVPDDRDIWLNHHQEALKDPKPREIQFRIHRKDGEVRWIEHACQGVFGDRGQFLGLRASNRDITKREFYKSETLKLQTKLAHIDRVVTISALTAALAHEINQPLAAMRSYAQAALRFMDLDPPEYDGVQKALQGIVADNRRAANVVNRLGDMVKRGMKRWETFDVNETINDVMGLLNSEIVLRNVSVALDLHPVAMVVRGDSIQIQQVLINLLTNAFDAVDDASVKTRAITISTRPENSNHIRVSISDSGSGISPDMTQAIFDPFHTTKPSGTGLGLAVCKSIIETHGGTIQAENKPDGGAVFSFILPTSSEAK